MKLRTLRVIQQESLEIAMQPQFTNGHLKHALRMLMLAAGRTEAHRVYRAARAKAKAHGVIPPTLRDLAKSEDHQLIRHGQKTVSP